MSTLLEITSENFDTIVGKSEKPVLVDFWASWCGPCRSLAPIIEEIAAEEDRIQVGKLNVDDNQAIAMRYRVMSIPTLILFKNGEIATVIVGAAPKAKILEQLTPHLD